MTNSIRNQTDSEQDKKSSDKKSDKMVRGSGFTYDEEKGRTDKSIPESQSDDDEKVKLPDLGQKNRP
jgi:hypothetical protein